MAQTTSTLAESVYLQVRGELLSGDLAPGSKLRIKELSARLGASPSVLREALTRLAAQGLVLAMPQRGFAVMELSIGDLEDLTRARRLVEMMALRESIADGDLAWESAVLATHHRLQRTPMNAPDGHVSDEWSIAHADFHHILLAGGRSSRLTAVASNLRDCSNLYLHWSRELAHDTSRDVAAEHQQIADLTVARDADAAAEALGRHIDRTTQVLVAYITERDRATSASA